MQKKPILLLIYFIEFIEANNTFLQWWKAKPDK